MAAKKNKHTAPVETADLGDLLDGEDGESGEPGLPGNVVELNPEAKEITPEQTKALFQAYDATGDAVGAAKLQAKALVDAAIRVRSDAVKAILEGTGCKVFDRGGAELTIVARVTKAKEGQSEHTTYFFKAAKKSTALKVD